MSVRSWPRWLFILFSCCLAGCEEPRADFFVVVPNAKDVVTGSPVLWRGENVGQISAIEPVEHGVRLEATLTPEHRDRLRADLRAAPVRSPRTGNAPVLEIYGGTNPKAPRIQRGQEVRTDGLIGRAESWFGSRDLAVIGTAAALLILFFFLRGALKLLSLLAAAAFCALALSFIRAKAGNDGSADLEARVGALADETINSPLAANAWRAIQRQFGSAGIPDVAEVERSLAAKTDELRRSGQADAAEELGKLTEQVGKRGGAIR